MTDETTDPELPTRVKVAIYDTATGKILRTAFCNPADAALQPTGEGEGLADVSADVRPNTHVINLTSLEAELRVSGLDEVKALKDKELSAACSFAIVSGFVSGSNTYPSFMEDQHNLLLMRDTGGTIYRQDTLSGDWSYDALTATEVQAVIADLRTHRDAQRGKLASLRSGLASASTPEAVAAISWD